MRAPGELASLTPAAGTGADMLRQDTFRLIALVLVAATLAAFAAAPALAQVPAGNAEDLRREIARLNEKYDSLKELIQLFGIVIGFVSLAGVVIWGKGELHAQQAISTINELYELSLRAAQQALGASLQQAKDWLDDIDNRAREFLKDKNDRDIVRTHVAKSKLAEISGEVRAYQRFTRQAWGSAAGTKKEKQDALPPPLTPRCYFVLGLGENLNQDYGAAIETWERGAAQEAPKGQSKQEDAALRALCSYWAGMANNNLGNYKAAQESFKAATNKLPVDRRERSPRYWEFEKLRLESWYFENYSGEPGNIQTVQDEVKGVLRRVRQLGQHVDPGPVLIVCGNILLGCAIENKLAATALQSAPLQRELLNDACSLFTGISNKWAAFGHAQALWQRNDANDRTEAGSLYERIVPDVANLLATRVEERSRILARTMGFICHCRLGERELATAERFLIVAGLGDIQEGSELYSQFVMRNVSKDEFRAQLQDFM